MAKLRLLKRFNRQLPGDFVEIAREADAKVLRLLGIAEDFVEGRRGRTATTTRDMRPEAAATEQQPPVQQSTQPEQPPAQPEEQTSHPVPAMSTEENKDAPAAPDAGNGGFGSDGYSRRDMQPKE